MSNIIVGLMLVDAPHSALNNAGSDAGDRTDNIVRVKSIRKGKKVYPYVSGQALRYWWRNTLEKKYGWVMSPIIRNKKISFTSVNPIDFGDDDVFGYMRAIKGNSEKGLFSYFDDENNLISNEVKLTKSDSVTRESPLKNCPLVSVVGQYPTSDFGVMARNEGDPVPYEHEFYSTILKGIFSLDLSNLGKFYEVEKTGFRNMYPRLVEFAEEKGLEHSEDCWVLDKETRIQRASDVISALPYLYGGAKNTSHLTDVTPKFIILAAINGGNHIFMNVVHEENDELKVDFDALKEVINDYGDILLTDVYIGIRLGFLNEIRDDLKELEEQFDNIHTGSINEMVDEFKKNIPELM